MIVDEAIEAVRCLSFNDQTRILYVIQKELAQETGVQVFDEGRMERLDERLVLLQSPHPDVDGIAWDQVVTDARARIDARDRA